jgi:hypothetical protein
MNNQSTPQPPTPISHLPGTGVFDVNNQLHLPFVLALNDPAATLEQAGGKGASLARLAAADLPVPPGFHVTTAAYRHL